jgi:hypothetical protein
MINYRFLNLPKNPLIKTSYVQQTLETAATTTNSYLSGNGMCCFENIEDFILPSVLETFQQLGLRPSFFASFASAKVSSKEAEKRVTHHDLQFDEKNNKWATIPFGINWEITPGDTIFQWWNIPSDPILPSTLHQSKLLNGAHYDQRNRIGIPNGAELIEIVQVTAPILVRTDIPHSVSFNSSAETRYNISLRFDLDNVPSWGRAVEVFKPLFL